MSKWQATNCPESGTMSCPFNQPDGDEEKKGATVVYGEYLMLEKVLNAQHMLSEKESGKVARDEHFFIIMHQTHELWFKEIIYELDFVCQDFQAQQLNVPEVVKRLNRVVMILGLLVGQLAIMGTMSPMEFNEFRPLLGTASGIQSHQFLVLQRRLGVDTAKVDDEDSLKDTSILQLLDEWLASMPHLDTLWAQFSACVPTSEQKLFATILDVKLHNVLKSRGQRQLSHRAFQAAILVSQHQDHFAVGHQILMLLASIEEMLSKWRFNHLAVVQRFIGTVQYGTGGSSAYKYLRSTLSDRHKVFVDISNAATFLLPKHHVPPVPSSVSTHWNRSDNQKSD